MKTRRFVGPSTRVVMHQLRQALGPDAVILSNRSVPDGVELIAASQAAVAALAGQASTEQGDELPAVPAATAQIPGEQGPLRADPARPRARHQFPTDATTPAAAESPLRFSPPPAPPAEAPVRAELLGELQEVKGLLRRQMETLAWSEAMRRRPLRATLLAELLAAGFTPALGRAMVDRLPDDYSEERARGWLVAALVRNLRAAPVDELVGRGGVFALVGPTGVGKTTTTAKIAARFVMKHGVQHLGLITTDGYRVGAQDQLRAYGKILGVPVLIVQDALDLQHAISALSGKRLVLIDTVGMGQRDPRVAEQHALLAGSSVQRLVLINATTQAGTLEDVVRAYGRGGGLAGAILTKLDEAARIGCGLDVLVRHKLRLHYVSTGQRVPEDLFPPRIELLVQRALRPTPAAPGLALDAEELGLLFGESGAAGLEVAYA